MNTSLTPVPQLDPGPLVDSGRIHLASNYNQLFTVEEAFVRLGQSAQTGELLVLNKDESIRIYVDKGFLIDARGSRETGEAAVILALNLEKANFVWAADVKPPEITLKLDLRQYVLRHSLARDRQIAQSLGAQQGDTLALPETDSGRLLRSAKTIDTGYYFVTAVDPMGRIVVDKAVTLIGREIYCDWVIDDSRISRKHCVLQLSKNGLLVRDMDATNGTFINGKLINDGYLKPNDKLSLGGYILMLRREAPTEKGPVKTEKRGKTVPSTLPLAPAV